jgi:sporadic carbohydrate cluster 2OG-Fe(II) oxygenase
MKKNKKLMKWINIKYGEAIIFSPNCLHGNIINSEETTRWSFNIRYKNLFSPYAANFNNEKKIGTFYNFLKPKIITKFNLNYSFDEFKF